MDDQRLADDVAGRHARVERRIGILVDHLHLPAVGQHLLPVEIGDVLAADPDRARRSAREVSAACGRPSTCRSRSRRPAPTSRRGRYETRRRRPRRPARKSARTRLCGPGNAFSAPRLRAAAGAPSARCSDGTAAHAAPPSRRSACQQATQWPGRYCSSGGYAARHWSVAKPQRGAKAAALRQVATSDGTMPLISFSRARPGSVRAATSTLGIEPSRPLGVGMPRTLEQIVGVGLLDLAAGVHHHHPVGILGDDAHVVGDQDDRGAERVAAVRASGRGSAPGWSRRARWSARRRSAPWGCTTAPWRSSRAGACRRRADADRRGRGARVPGYGRGAASRPPGPWHRARDSPWCSAIASLICRPTVSSGLSEVIGSWKIIEMSLPRMRLHLVLAQVQQIGALETDGAADDAPGRVGDEAQDGQRGDALAAAGLADHAEGLAGCARL